MALNSANANVRQDWKITKEFAGKSVQDPLFPMHKSSGDGGGMDLINYRLDQLDKRADKTEAKLDKLVDAVNAMNINLTSSTESLKGRLDLIEKKLPNWWQPYVGVGAISVLLAAMVAIVHVIFH